MRRQIVQGVGVGAAAAANRHREQGRLGTLQALDGRENGVPANP